MTTTTFTNGVTLTDADWFNDVDFLVYDIFQDAASASAAFANIKQAATTSATGVVELATSAEVQTGTDAARVITPSTFRSHSGSIKGWVKADTGGGQVVAYNVTSLSDRGTGQVDVTWGIDFSGVHYVAGGAAQSDALRTVTVHNSVTPTATLTVFDCFDSAGNLADPNNWHLWAMGD